MPTTLVRTRSTAMHTSFTGMQTLLNEMATHSGGQAQTESSWAGKGLAIVSLHLHNTMRGMVVAHKGWWPVLYWHAGDVLQILPIHKGRRTTWQRCRVLAKTPFHRGQVNGTIRTNDHIRWHQISPCCRPGHPNVRRCWTADVSLMGKVSPLKRSQRAWREPKAEPTDRQITSLMPFGGSAKKNWHRRNTT